MEDRDDKPDFAAPPIGTFLIGSVIFALLNNIIDNFPTRWDRL